jgi:hypothetical protein
MGLGAAVAGTGQIRRHLCPVLVDLRPKRADLRAFFWGKSFAFPGVFGTFGRVRAAKGVKPKVGVGKG